MPKSNARVVPGSSADRFFEMHGQNIYTSQERRPGRHVDFLSKFPGPVYMHQLFEDVPNATVYPLQELADGLFSNVWRIGHTENAPGKTNSSGSAQTPLIVSSRNDTKSMTGEPYISSSIAYEIALAIYEGFEEIHLYGVDLNTEAEYAWQKPGVEWMLGKAAGRGIKVVLPDNCPLGKGTLYGRGFMSETPEHMSYQQLETRLKSLRHEAEQWQVQQAKVEGARMELNEFVRSQMLPGINQLDVQKLDEHYAKLQQQAIDRLEQLKGQQKETELYFVQLQGRAAVLRDVVLAKMPHGVLHEAVDTRRKELDRLLSEKALGVHKLEGAIQETGYWLHQTMEGQEPKEAIDQLRAMDNGLFRAEGPIDELEVLQHRQFSPDEALEAIVAPI